MDYGIFRFVNPPDETALQQCIDALDACSYPLERCLPELEDESGGFVTVVWEDTGQGNSGIYVGGTKNQISLNSRYPARNWAFTFLHEIGHMVDDTVLRDEQRVALVEKWHTDLDGRWDGYIQNGEEIEWSHNTPHTHSSFWGGWRVSDAHYYHKPNEAFADAFVACFAPTHFPYPRFAHWSNDTAGVRAIILAEEAVEPESTFPNDSIYRLYRAYFLREPDEDGYAYWKGEIARGITLHQISNFFAASQEFRTRYGSLSNLDFVRLVYRNVLGRAPDEGGQTYWVGLLDRGLSRGAVMLGFSESDEFRFMHS